MQVQISPLRITESSLGAFENPYIFSIKNICKENGPSLIYTLYISIGAKGVNSCNLKSPVMTDPERLY